LQAGFFCGLTELAQSRSLADTDQTWTQLLIECIKRISRRPLSIAAKDGKNTGYSGNRYTYAKLTIVFIQRFVQNPSQRFFLGTPHTKVVCI
jgi:hypothetical protein